MSNQTVTLEGMQGAEQHIGDAETTSKSVRSNVESELHTLAATWTGEAANKFQEAGRALLSHVDAVNGGLAGLHNAVTQSKNQYEKTHGMTVDGASSVGSQVNAVTPYQGLGI